MAAALAAATGLAAGCGSGATATAPAAGDGAAVADAARPAPVVAPELIATAGHDPGSYTQGLVWHRGRLFESAGQYGASQVRELDPRTGRPVRSRRLGAAYFGEGLALHRDRLIQLTWRERTAFVWDRDTFRRRGTFTYRGEGWGLASRGGRLVMSDGTAVLRFLDPATFRVVRRVRVTDGGRPVRGLNELESVGGLVWANVYLTEDIVAIDPASGRVRVRLRLSGLIDRLPPDPRIEVLNGIAWDPARDRVLVTGKYWPRMFWIRPPAATRR